MAKQKIIIDCDTGKDDAIAIMTAAGSADLELLAVTTVAGNVEVSLTTANSLRVLEYLGLNVPVYAGCDRPLVRDQILAKAVHGRNGLLNRDFVELTRSPEKEHAVSYLIRTLMAGDGDIVVCATGPLTNLAMALRLEPRIAQKIQKIVLMGGSAGFGNTTPAAEFNIYADPEAAAVVYSSGVPIVMMGLDLTEQTVVDDSTLKRLRGLGNRAGSLCADILQEQIDQHAYQVHVHDVTTVMYVSEPPLFSLKPVYAEIDLSHGPCYGRTVCDLNNRYHKAANIEIGLQLDCDRFWAGVEERLSHLA